jgi:hypothetical protein
MIFSQKFVLDTHYISMFFNKNASKLHFCHNYALGSFFWTQFLEFWTKSPELIPITYICSVIFLSKNISFATFFWVLMSMFLPFYPPPDTYFIIWVS